MTIADLSVMEAEVLVDETDVIKVKTGKRAEVTVDAIPGKVMAGEVTEVGNSAITSPVGRHRVGRIQGFQDRHYPG